MEVTADVLNRRSVLEMAGKQTSRQVARQKVATALVDRQRARAAREKRLGDAAVEVLTALVERDEAVVAAERSAGGAIGRMLKEGMSLAEVAEYCGGEVDVKELGRLSRLAESQEG
jgi:hypothetical protein